MSNMDELLRRALLEANLRDAEDVSVLPERSAHYQREQLRLCAAPLVGQDGGQGRHGSVRSAVPRAFCLSARSYWER